jgi:hypothetical protein
MILLADNQEEEAYTPTALKVVREQTIGAAKARSSARPSAFVLVFGYDRDEVLGLSRL